MDSGLPMAIILELNHRPFDKYFKNIPLCYSDIFISKILHFILANALQMIFLSFRKEILVEPFMLSNNLYNKKAINLQIYL